MEHIRRFSRYAFLYLGILLLLKSIVFGMEAKLIYFRFKTLPMTYILQIRCGGEGGFKNFSTGGSNVWNNHVGSRITSFNKKIVPQNISESSTLGSAAFFLPDFIISFNFVHNWEKENAIAQKTCKCGKTLKRKTKTAEERIPK